MGIDRISGGPFGSGRSPNSDKIYDEYLKDAGKIDSLITDLNNQIHDLPRGADKERADLLSRIDALNKIRNGALHENYQQGYVDNITFEEYEKNRGALIAEAQKIHDGGGSGNNIQKDLDEASRIVDNLEGEISSDESTLKSLYDQIAAWEKVLHELEGKATSEPAISDLAKAKKLLNSLKGKVSKLETSINSLHDQLTKAEGLRDQLQELAKKGEPSERDIEKADSLLAEIGVIKTSFEREELLNFTGNKPSAKEINSINQAIQVVQDDLVDVTKKIQEAIDAAKKSQGDLQKTLNDLLALFDALKGNESALEASIRDLEAKISQMPEGADKAKALKDLQTAQNSLATLKGQIGNLENQVTNTKQQIVVVSNLISKMEALAKLDNPSQDDLNQAKGYLQQINNTQGVLTALSDAIKAANVTATQVSKAIDVVKADLNPKPPTPTGPGGDGGYIDLALFYQNAKDNCLIWWPLPEHFDKGKLDAFLQTFFDKMKASGISDLELSFAELKDIDAMLNGKGAGGAQTNKILEIFDEHYLVEGESGPNASFLGYFTQAAHKNGMHVDLSFGGAAAGQGDWAIQGDAVAQARKLVEFMDLYGIDGLDIDVEAKLMAANKDPQEVLKFFQTLHQELSSRNPPQNINLTTLGSFNEVMNGQGLGILFDHFNECFDNLNLMLYNGQFYLDADNETWGVKQWLELLNKNGVDASKVHIGFYSDSSKFKYYDKNASAGKDYNVPPGLSNGEAAAYIYLEMLKELGLSPDDFGEPFFWTDRPQEFSSNNFMEDFNRYISQHK